MRFCPFCSAENADELAVCQACGRRRPPLPPRRARNAPPTGIQLPPRPQASAPPPPPPPARKPEAVVPVGPPVTQPGIVPAARPPTAQPAPRDSAPALPPPPAPGAAPNRGGIPRPDTSDVDRLLDAITPGPAAERREPPPADPMLHVPGRRKADGLATRSPSPSQPPPMRPNSPSQPPPMRSNSPSQPPPLRSNSPSQPPPLRSNSPSQPPPGRAKPASQPPPFRVPAFPGDEATAVTAPPLEIARAPSDFGEPPPTRLHRSEAHVDRPFTPPSVFPVPEIPEPGLVNAARYAYFFWRARWQRRGAIKQLGVEIKQDTEALDQVLGSLGAAARGARVEGRVFAAENAAISAAEERIATLHKDRGEVEARQAEENSKFVDVERERNEKLTEAERLVEEAQRELSHLEGQRRSLRDKRKELERRQKAYVKAAEDNERQAGSAQLDQRQDLRKVAEGHRREAAALEPDRQEIDRRLGALERPISEATAKQDAAKAELDAAKRSLSDAREGHTHRLAELDSEQKRKAREVALAESEIQRRLVTLGTLVNLNRIDDAQFAELYQRIDRLRGAITSRTTEIEKLTAEREAYDRGTLVRGIATIGGAFVALIALIVILRAII